MKRRVIFTLSELLDKVEELLTPHIGVSAAIIGNQHFVMAILENFCYGTPIPSSDEFGYIVPSEIFQRIQNEVKQYIHRSAQTGFGVVWPSFSYGFFCLGDDIVLEELDEPRPVPETAQSIQESIENGDYVPERLRRQWG